jgi:hypothetical protein
MIASMGDKASSGDSKRGRARRTFRHAAVFLVLLAAFFALTTVTGFPGPGPLHRYPMRDLKALADRINEDARSSAASYACSRGRDIASVDPVASRVMIRGNGLAMTLNAREIEMVRSDAGGPVFAGVTCEVP